MTSTEAQVAPVANASAPPTDPKQQSSPPISRRPASGKPRAHPPGRQRSGKHLSYRRKASFLQLPKAATLDTDPIGYTTTYPRQEKVHPTAKNRVWGFFAEPNKLHPANCLQAPQPRREIDPAPTKTASGLFFYGYSYYDPVTGSWASRDPIREGGGLNLSGFVGNDGVTGYDYHGRKKCQLSWHGLESKNECGNAWLEWIHGQMNADWKGLWDQSAACNMIDEMMNDMDVNSDEKRSRS
ncbi:MAG: hypothetical protein O3A87_06270 [Verrucomicrobia bacterium]|nr:hypothetical protein [Verrucomicrobiota bacterium]MDA1006071.1 hypothetical protein [Verrucomicrobiota bacterium]